MLRGDDFKMSILRSEYPRPQFVREEWINLNGVWEFENDTAATGQERCLNLKEHLSGTITVPFCKESKLSGINDREFTLGVWYKRSFVIPAKWRETGRRTLLNIDACDYLTAVYVNGTYIGEHMGGMSSFSMDITDFLTDGENTVTVFARDDTRKPTQPSGKQSTIYYSGGAHYTRVTGIWQTVWLENVPCAYIVRSKCTSDVDNSSLAVELTCKNAHGKRVSAAAYYNGKKVGEATAKVHNNTAIMTVALSELHLWDIGSPELYDIEFTLGEDNVKSYFGMRTVDFDGGMFRLNGRKVFQRLILDQGYYPDGLYTAPSDEELQNDIKRSMAMGFNGARLHQKVFEPRFLYHCDRMGYIVWGEFDDWGLNTSLEGAWRGILPEWLEILQRDYNHPSIVGWCPLNEIVPTADYYLLKQLIDMTHAFDATRPIIDVSGMTHKPGLADILDEHDYEQNPEIYRERYKPLTEGKAIKMFNFFADAPDFIGKPSFMSEYGGISWKMGDKEGWGYGNAPATEEEFIARFKGLTEVLLENPAFCAFCYTQLTDVEQEINGLYTYDRIAKFAPEIIAPIVRQPAAYEKE